MDKVYCPGCGEEMQFLPYDEDLPNDCGRYYCKYDDWAGPQRETKEEARAAAMERAQPENRALTLEEVRGFHYCPVLITDHKNGPLEWRDTNFVINKWAHPESEMSKKYGRTWRCFNPLKGCPTDKERKAGWGK